MSDTNAPLVSPGRLRPASNAATPIANIPDDVLLDIFRIVVEQSDYMTRKLLRKGKTWLAVTHVCTYWRNSILDTAELWTRLRFWSFFNQKLARAFLQRAGNRLVSLEYRGSGPRPLANPMTIASFIDSNSSHLGALSIIELDETETAVFCGKLRTPAMNLQRLEIQSHVGQHTVVYPIFTNTLPALRVFRITGLWITLPHAANLRELVLLECRSVPFEALLKYLHEMPLLEVLHIDKARDSRREWPPVSTLPFKPPLLMPHLRSLTLSFTHPEDLFVALRLIAFPPAAAVHLHFREMQTLTITAFPDVPPSLEAITSSISDVSIATSSCNGRVRLLNRMRTTSSSGSSAPRSTRCRSRHYVDSLSAAPPPSVATRGVSSLVPCLVWRHWRLMCTKRACGLLAPRCAHLFQMTPFRCHSVPS